MTVAEVAEAQNEILTAKEAEKQAAQEAAAQEGTETRECELCGRTLKVRVSRSKKNPGRKYFKCQPCDSFSWADSKPLPLEARKWVHEALRALADVCDGCLTKDGQGFNGSDTGWGRAWAMMALEELKEGMAIWAFKRLVKYKEQLGDFGLWPAPKALHKYQGMVK
jgi:hypothetical protein